MAHHTQLTIPQKYQIQVLHQTRIAQKDIARQVGVSPATISRELARNRLTSPNQAYQAEYAQQQAHQQRTRRTPYKLKGPLLERVKTDFRQDLLNAGKGNGEHGYGIPIPAPLKNGQSHSLSIRVSGTGFVLSNSPRTITCSPSGGRLAAPDEAVAGLVVYPNPTTDQVTLAFFLDERETAQVTIVDVLGRAVYTNRVVGEGKTHREPVSLRGQDAGTFIVRVASGKRKLSGKVILMR